MAFQGENSGRVSRPMRYRFSNSNGLAVAILTVAALAYSSGSAAPSHGEELKIDTQSIAQAILRDTNAYRQSKGLPALAIGQRTSARPRNAPVSTPWMPSKTTRTEIAAR